MKEEDTNYNLALPISLPRLQKQSGELIQYTEVCTSDVTLAEMNTTASNKWQNLNLQT